MAGPPDSSEIVVDDRDQESKATFALVLSLSRLDFGRQPPGAPFLTLPVGR